MCTAMLYDPKDHYEPQETKAYFENKKKVFERLLHVKQVGFLKKLLRRDKHSGGSASSLIRFFFKP
jgi:hypothetical protein